MKHSITLIEAIDVAIWKWDKYVENGGYSRILKKDIPVQDDNVQRDIYLLTSCGLCFYQAEKNFIDNTSMYSGRMCCDCPFAIANYGTTCTDEYSIFRRWVDKFSESKHESEKTGWSPQHIHEYIKLHPNEELKAIALEIKELLIKIKEYHESKENQQK